MASNRPSWIFGRNLDSSIDAEASAWVARRDAGLTEDEQRALGRWLDSDPRHRLAFARFESAWTAFDKPRRSAQGPEMRQALAAFSKRRRQRRVGLTAGVVVSLVCGAVFWGERSHPPAAPRPALAAATTVVRLPALQTLADGSVVELDQGARISVDFSSAVRRVRLVQGNALFRVAKNPARPFVVGAAGVEVKAVGTVFAVQLSVANVDVLVTEGKVSVKPVAATAGSGGDPGRPTLVAAGNRLEIPVSGTDPFPAAAVPFGPSVEAERLAWRSHRIEFNGTPLSEAVTFFNERAGASSAPRLVIGDAAVGAVRVSGVFRADNSEAFAALLESAFGVQGERHGGTIVLRRR